MIATRSPIEAAVKAAIDSSSFNSRFAKSLTGSVAVALSFGFGAIAHAQTAPSAAAGTGPATLEEVTVTGSRIKRTTDFNTSTPTTVIDSSTMENLGIVNVGQALTAIPANVSTFTPANTGNSNFFTGASIANLRGLNPFFGSRTLVLVNSRRFVPTEQGDQVDLNFIPQILVDRIDTVTGGASAAYGSGAIAGVMNAFLDTKLEGGKLNGDFYQTHQSDDRDRHLGAAFGHSLFDNRVHFVIGGEYENQDSLNCEDVRTWCAKNHGLYQTDLGAPGVTTLAEAYNVHSNQLSTTGVFYHADYPPIFGGPVVPGNQTLQATPDGTNTTPFFYGQQPQSTAFFGNGSVVPGGDGTPLYQYTNLQAPVNKGLITGLINAQVTDNINFSADVNWGRVRTTNFNGALTDTNDHLAPDSAWLALNPALAAAAAATATAPGIFGPGGPAFSKDWTSQTSPYTTFTTTVKRFSFGFDGKFGQSSWSWDSYYQYGQTKHEQLVNDNRHLFAYNMAIDSVIGPNGQPECRVTAEGFAAATAPGSPGAGYALADPLLAVGCVPLNPFGNQPISAAAKAYSFGQLDEQLTYEQTVAALDASGDYFQGVGAGPFSLAAGFEWRQEVGHNDELNIPGYIRTDYLIQYGEPFAGKVTVDEAFLETNIPLLKDVPFAKSLSIDIAARQSRYENQALSNSLGASSAGQTFDHNLTTWKASLNWEPTEWLRIRGSQSRDARAANFRELYYGQIIHAGGIFGFCGRQFGTDPCTWDLEGNVNLKPETSDTTTFGIVLTPKDVLAGFEFSADYFHIKIKDAIEQASVQNVERDCQLGVQTACNQLVFASGAAGQAAYQAGNPLTGGVPDITNLTALAFNGAAYEVKGVDFSLNYLASLPNGATLNTRLVTTFMDQQTFQNGPGGPVFNILGQTGTGNTFLNDYTPDAKWRGSLTLTYSQGPWSVTPTINFLSHGTRDYLGVTPADGAIYNQVVSGTAPPAIAALGLHPMLDNHVPSYYVVGLNTTYSFENLGGLKGAQVFVQISNLLNKTPPFADGGGGFGPANSYGGTNPIFFDTFGLAWRAGFRLSF